MEQVQNESGRQVKRNIEFYNLDAIISIGYRISSKQGTYFRQWATKVINKHILNGFTINKKRLGTNYSIFIKAVEDIKMLLPQSIHSETSGILEIIKIFANTWLSLDAYDKELFPKKGQTIKKIDLTSDELVKDVQKLKQTLLKNKTASALFAIERSESALGSIFRNVYQSFGGHEIYPTLEEKAANLLYLIIKDHPLIDGNKRTAAFCLIWFLQKAGLLNTLKLSPEVLTTITIMIAESKMEDKEKMIGIVLMLINT
jgi:death-on-curing family protein